MKIVYIQSSYKPSDLVGGWFSATQQTLRQEEGGAWIAIKYTHRPVQPQDIIIGDSVSCGLHYRFFDYLGLQDMFSFFATKKFLRRLEEIKPDIIHCHVIHDCFLHFGLLTDYVNRKGIKVVWTFHDSRVMTGFCPCPMYCECNQWTNTCRKCPTNDTFLVQERGWLRLVRWVHSYRKHTIGKIKNLTIVTPSVWMSTMVKRSYLKERKCVVIHNGINLDVFSPMKSDIRVKYNIPNSSIVLLAVGNPIGKLKGRDFLLRLIGDLPDNYHVVLIGALEDDLEELNNRDNVVALPRIDREELIKFYSAADLFVYPTLADNFPTVCLEAQACGLPVVAFDSEGTKETVAPKGVVVPRKDYEALKNAIVSFDYQGAKDDAVLYASKFNQDKCVNEYLELYKRL